MRDFNHWVVTVVMAASGEVLAAECVVQLSIQIPAEVEPAHDGYVNPDDIVVSLRNVGKHAVTLVHPGDGSLGGRRTPIVSWLVDGKVNSIDAGFCGNINPLKAEEVFRLLPGETARLTSWIPLLYLKDAGTHEVRLTYRNDPTLRTNGVPLGVDDPGALERLKGSTPCDLQSNTVSVKVRTPKP